MGNKNWADKEPVTLRLVARLGTIEKAEALKRKADEERESGFDDFADMTIERGFVTPRGVVGSTDAAMLLYGAHLYTGSASVYSIVGVEYAGQLAELLEGASNLIRDRAYNLYLDYHERAGDE